MQYKIKKDNEECGFSAKQITFLEKLIGIERKDWKGKTFSCNTCGVPVLKLFWEIIYSGKKKEKAEPKEENNLPSDILQREGLSQKEENTPAPPKEETSTKEEETQSSAEDNEDDEF